MAVAVLIGPRPVSPAPARLLNDSSGLPDEAGPVRTKTTPASFDIVKVCATRLKRVGHSVAGGEPSAVPVYDSSTHHCAVPMYDSSTQHPLPDCESPGCAVLARQRGAHGRGVRGEGRWPAAGTVEVLPTAR